MMKIKVTPVSATTTKVVNAAGEVILELSPTDHLEMSPYFLTKTGYAPVAECINSSSEGVEVDKYLLAVSGTSGKTAKRTLSESAIPKFEQDLADAASGKDPSAPPIAGPPSQADLELNGEEEVDDEE